MTEVSTQPATSGESMKSVARGGSANLVGAAVTALCTFALTVVVARGMSRVEAGVFFSASSLFLVATTVGQLGTQTGLVYFVSRCRALGRFDAIDSYLRAARRPVLLVALVMAIATFACARPLAEVTAHQHVAETTTYLRILAVFIPVAALETLYLSGTRGLGSMRPNNLIEQIGRPLVQLGLVALVAGTASSAWVGWAWSVAYIPALYGSWWAWRSLRRRLPRSSHDGREEVGRQFWKFSLPRALTSVIQMLLQRFDIVLVGAIAGLVAAAIYAAATRFIVVGQLGTNALTLAAQPQLAKTLSINDHHGTNEIYQMSTAWLILVTWPMYLTLILFGKPLLLVFGKGYITGQSTIVIISFSMLIATGLGLVDTVLAMAGHTSWNLGNAFLALAVNLGLDLWLIPIHGILGAAIGWAVAIGVRNIAAVTQVGWALKLHPFARETAAAAGLSVVCFVGLLGLVRLGLGDTVTGLLVGLAVALVGFGVGLWLLRRVFRLRALVGAGRRTRTGHAA